jgi:AcrR family transcriptional regulator
MKQRTYHQTARAEAAAQRTERILTAALELFVERPFDQITLAAVAERAEVGLQTVIRRVGTKDGLVAAVTEWAAGEVARDRGAPTDPDPEVVAARIAHQYDRWAEVTDRTMRQADSSPALAASAAGGRRAHREWIEKTFSAPLSGLPLAQRKRLLASLAAICGVEVWLVLTRDHGLSTAEARTAMAELISAALTAALSSDQHPASA